MRSLLLLLFAFPSTLMSQSFSGTGAHIPDDGTMIAFDLPVSGLPALLDTSNFGLEKVCINLTHTWNSDLSIALKTPDGRTLTLFSGLGGDQDGFANTCLSGNSPTFIFDAVFPFTGTFRPFGDMGILNRGGNPNGTWQLLILDTYAFADEGELFDWSITFGNEPCKPFPFYSSHLPIVKIETGGNFISNDPKAEAQIKIIDNGPNQLNYANQNNYAFEGPIGIELRGNSSQGYPKKSYQFETRDDLGEDMDTSLLHLPSTSDFVLHGNFADKTHVRNPIAYEVFRKMGHYATRTRYCELLLDGTYQGLYVLTEDIKRGDERVDIAKLEDKDSVGTALTGGYILKIDWNRSPGWNSEFTMPNSANTTYFQHEYPKFDRMLPVQVDYIRSYVDSFETALHGEDFQDPQLGWRNFAQEGTFIDYLLLNELSKNVDGYRLSTFFHKNRDDHDGRLVMGPPWDYDLSWYNADYCNNFLTSEWAYNINYVCKDAGVPFWWERLMSDSLFAQNTACRWQALRHDFLSTPAFNALVDSLTTVIGDAQVRNFTYWPILGKYVWPNPGQIPTTYEGEVEKMKNWVSERASWLDFILEPYLSHVSAQFSATPLNAYQWEYAVSEHPGWQYHWDFGDGNSGEGATVQHQFPGAGTYTVRLTSSTPYGCSAESAQIIHIVNTGVHENKSELGVQIQPNPSTDACRISWPSGTEGKLTIRLRDALGALLFTGECAAIQGVFELRTRDLPSGVYGLEVEKEGAIQRLRLIRQ